LQANFTRVAPFVAETRFGAPHFPQVCLDAGVALLHDNGLALHGFAIRRSASSRIDCFDIRIYLS